MLHLPVSIPVRVLGVLELRLWFGLGLRVRVSIPVRVLGVLEPRIGDEDEMELIVSIPVRVLGVLEPDRNVIPCPACKGFQSL